MGSAHGPPSAVTLPMNERTAVYSWTFKMTLCPEPNNRLQRTVMDRVPRRTGQRAAAEPRRWA